MVAPLLQTLFVAELEVNVTLPPAQNVVEAPPVEMVGVAGNAFTVTVIILDVAVQLLALVTAHE